MNIKDNKIRLGVILLIVFGMVTLSITLFVSRTMSLSKENEIIDGNISSPISDNELESPVGLNKYRDVKLSLSSNQPVDDPATPYFWEDFSYLRRKEVRHPDSVQNSAAIEAIVQKRKLRLKKN